MMLQPREKVAGIQRDALLSLEDDAQPARQLIVDLTLRVYESVLVGNQAPVVKAVFQRMTHPQVGDLVLETSSRSTDHRAFGYLLDQRTEWMHSNADWAIEDQYAWDNERPTEEAVYIQYGPAPVDVCRWTNCMILAVPLVPGRKLL